MVDGLEIGIKVFVSLRDIMNLELSALEIKILMKCSEGLLNKRYASQLYKKETKPVRDAAIEHLIKKEFIAALKMPKQETKKTPTFYKLTEKGKDWLDKYNKNYPR